jgi:hypothetical protein
MKSVSYNLSPAFITLHSPFGKLLKVMSIITYCCTSSFPVLVAVLNAILLYTTSHTPVRFLGREAFQESAGKYLPS